MTHISDDSGESPGTQFSDPAPMLHSPAAGAVDADATAPAAGDGLIPPSPAPSPIPERKRLSRRERMMRSLIRQAEFYARDVPVTLPRVRFLEEE